MSGSDMPIQPQQAIDPLGALRAAEARAAADKASSPDQAAKDFESVLLGKLLDEMKRTIPDSGLLSGGITKQVQDIFWMYLARDLADSGGLGLWKDISRAYGAAAPGTEPAR
ncbi:MAG: hypothetical protein KGY99_04815 [Phycisphaerae bacterium]|nr:hypothetical protein [Phycisphaerae bacterium]